MLLFPASDLPRFIFNCEFNALLYYRVEQKTLSFRDIAERELDNRRLYPVKFKVDTTW